MLENLLRYLEESESPLSYLVLAVSAAVEYLFPPFPADTITLFGIFLAATAGYSVVIVYVSVTGGSVAGCLGAYGFGRWLGSHQDRWPRFLRTEGAQKALATVQRRFEQHGPIYLTINRFVPALRAFFFVAAGLTRMPVGKVALFGGISAALWNALLLAVGYAIGRNWERLQALSRQYTYVTLAVVAVIAIVLLIRWRRRR